VLVLDPAYEDSHEHNQLVLAEVPAPAELAALAESTLGHLGHRRITVLDDAAGAACVPALTAAGYQHETDLVMTYSGPAPALPVPPAQSVPLAELRPSLLRQLRAWMPLSDDSTVRQLADRRAARLHGAEQVRFLAVRDPDGTVGSWADLYLDPAQDIAQIEDLVTADTHHRRGYADTVLATALHQASGCGLVFLLADPEDWPQTWYARRGFTAAGYSHGFTRRGAGG
jgi:hypothetical protein